jgi:nicotinic acid mononucleotide adenylyltransferase
MKKVNILIGRFQPITNGHVKCAQVAFEQKGIPTVLCMIETPDSKVDARHPFPSSLTVPMYKDLFSHNKKAHIEDIVLVKNADIIKIAEVLRANGYEPQSWTCGTDRVDSYKAMAEKYHERAELPDDFEVIEIKRGDEDESATKLRDALARDDKDTFFKMFPAISLSVRVKTDIYSTLRNQLLSI